MGRPVKKVKKDNYIGIKAESDIQEWLDRKAEDSRSSVSQVVRELIFEAMKKEYGK